jgi:hypothetical protein
MQLEGMMEIQIYKGYNCLNIAMPFSQKVPFRVLYSLCAIFHNHTRNFAGEVEFSWTSRYRSQQLARCVVLVSCRRKQQGFPSKATNFLEPFLDNQAQSPTFFNNDWVAKTCREEVVLLLLYQPRRGV